MGVPAVRPSILQVRIHPENLALLAEVGTVVIPAEKCAQRTMDQAGVSAPTSQTVTVLHSLLKSVQDVRQDSCCLGTAGLQCQVT